MRHQKYEIGNTYVETLNTYVQRNAYRKKERRLDLKKNDFSVKKKSTFFIKYIVIFTWN